MVVALGIPHSLRKPPHGFDFSPCFHVRIDMIEVEEAKQLQARGGGSLGCSVAVCFKNSRKTMGHGEKPFESNA